MEIGQKVVVLLSVMWSIFRNDFGTVKLFTIICVSLAYLTGCNDTHSIYVSARINQPRADYIMSLEVKDVNMTIRSSGGNENATSQLAVHLLTKNLSLDVHGFCFSECAEFLLPAADELNFINMPMIGFNWGPMMDYKQYVESQTDVSTCPLGSLANQKKLLKSRNLNADFWKEIETRIIITKFLSLDIGKNCPLNIREFENQIWLPTGMQLRELWGLKFEGSVCADDFEKCKVKIDDYWSKGKRIVVGDEVYISKGSKL